jgi:hypothetical protein
MRVNIRSLQYTKGEIELVLRATSYPPDTKAFSETPLEQLIKLNLIIRLTPYIIVRPDV